MAESGNNKITKAGIVLICILLFSFLIRLYYMTMNKALWWDEAVYMSKAKSIALSKDLCGWESLRPPLIPYLLGFIFKITGVSETLAKFIMVLFSVSCVYLLYEIAKKLYSEKIALFSSALYSTSWLVLFFTARIMTEMPSTFFFMLALYFYIVYKESWQKYFFTGFFSVLSFASRFPMIIVLIPIFIDILIRQKQKAFTNKNNYIILLGVVIPMTAYFAYNYAIYADFFLPLIGATGGVTDMFPVFYYLTNAGHIFTWPLFAVSVIGIVLACLKPKQNSMMLLWFFVVFIAFSSIPRKEERYLLPLVPALCLFASLPLFLFKKSLGENFDYFLVIALLFFGYFQISYAEQMITPKAESYLPVKEMSLWLKENTPETATVLTKSKPQVCYYAERTVNPIPDTLEEFEQSALENDYTLISVFEPHPEYAYSLNYTPVSYIPNFAVIYKLR